MFLDEAVIFQKVGISSTVLLFSLGNLHQSFLYIKVTSLQCFSLLDYLEYSGGAVNLTAIRTIRVLRPLRAINRIPSECVVMTGMRVTPVSIRHEDPGDAAPGHAPHAGQCPPPLLLRLLHLRDHGGSDVGWAAQAEMLHQ